MRLRKYFNLRYITKSGGSTYIYNTNDKNYYRLCNCCNHCSTYKWNINQLKDVEENTKDIKYYDIHSHYGSFKTKKDALKSLNGSNGSNESNEKYLSL